MNFRVFIFVSDTAATSDKKWIKKKSQFILKLISDKWQYNSTAPYPEYGIPVDRREDDLAYVKGMMINTKLSTS